MIFRIMAYGKGKTDAYAELLDRIELMADNRVFCVFQDGSCSFTDRASIMYNPSIIRHVSGIIYKINTDGYGIPETKRAGKDEDK